MKKLKKHVVIGTTAGLTGLFLTACGAYGPATTQQYIPDDTEGATMEISVNEESKQDTPAAASSSSSLVETAEDSAASGANSEPDTDASSLDSSAGSGKISFSEVGTVSGEDSIGAMNSASIDKSDLEFYDPKNSPVPTVYGPPVSDK